MSSVNDCIKFDLDIKDKNIVFYNNFYKFFNGVQYKVYEALLKQPACAQGQRKGLLAAPNRLQN